MIRYGSDKSIKYITYLICHISERTHNTYSDIVNYLGRENLGYLYEYADIIHCEYIENIVTEFVEKCNIPTGNFVYDYKKQTHTGLSSVFHYLIVDVQNEINKEKGMHIVDTLIEVYNSYIGKKLLEFDNCLYWQTPEIIFDSYIENEIIDF